MISPSRILPAARYYVTGIYHELMVKNVFLGAQATAFKVMVTFLPVVVLTSGLVGKFIKRERPFQYLGEVIREFFPDYQSEQLIEYLVQLQDVSGTLTIVGIVGLVLAAMTLFTTLRSVFAMIFREEWHGERSILGGYLFDFRMVMQVGVFFFASILITVALQVVDNTGNSVLLELGVQTEWIQHGWRTIFTSTGAFLPFVLTTAVFFQLFYFIPIPRSEWRSALVGAVFTAIVWEMAKVGFTRYATGVGGFEEGWFTPLGDTFILAFASVAWAYYSGIVLNIGAIITLLHEKRYREHKAERTTQIVPPAVSDSVKRDTE